MHTYAHVHTEGTTDAGCDRCPTVDRALNELV